ncbi:hypothetical protein D9757_006092 [Collybiopsis confluens]|uniref:Histone chaperone domain-containing protein n=1 Tax=Collybiopsis confluens TaxID=2823264 RepID=A0A8H5HID4_9AGAR|nr:hypothetical protein D9757_006092 [Collybiopsis confluens]
MSTDATEATVNSGTNASTQADASPTHKGKGKATKQDQSMEVEDDDDDDDDEEEDDEEEEDSDEETDDAMEEIDPTVIKARRTRGIKVDYTSKEALEKAGLNPKDIEEDEEDEMKEN